LRDRLAQTRIAVDAMRCDRESIQVEGELSS
jgi:hypothetical protein